jgi:hypothetical protein
MAFRPKRVPQRDLKTLCFYIVEKKPGFARRRRSRRSIVQGHFDHGLLGRLQCCRGFGEAEVFPTPGLALIIELCRPLAYIPRPFGQCLAFAFFQPALLRHGPAFEAMAVPAGIVERDFLSAIGAFLVAASEPFGAAADYVRHDFEPGRRQTSCRPSNNREYACGIRRRPRIRNCSSPSSLFSLSAGASPPDPRRSRGLLTDAGCFLET